MLEAADGPRALATWDEHAGEIDLLLTDVVMPGMSGKELAEQAGDRARVHVGLHRRRHLRHGMEGLRLVQKPFDAQTLLGAVRSALDDERLALEQAPSGDLGAAPRRARARAPRTSAPKRTSPSTSSRSASTSDGGPRREARLEVAQQLELVRQLHDRRGVARRRELHRPVLRQLVSVRAHDQQVVRRLHGREA